ncbi:hypothetical protein ACTFIZ_010610 [Dictyostelium cf. discoideum]
MEGNSEIITTINFSKEFLKNNEIKTLLIGHGIDTFKCGPNKKGIWVLKIYCRYLKYIMIVKHKLKENKTVNYCFQIPKQYLHYNSIKVPFESYLFSKCEIDRLLPSSNQMDKSLYLNDEIINNMLALLKLKIGCDFVQIYHTYFSVDKIELRDISDSSFIYLPVNIINSHWFLVVLIIHSDESVSILRVDSQEIEPKFIGELKKRLDLINVNVKEITSFIISQPNQNECGILTILFSSFLCDLFEKDDFLQQTNFFNYLSEQLNKIGIENEEISLIQANRLRMRILNILENKEYNNHWYDLKK